MKRSPEALMRTYLIDVALHGRLELIDEIAQPDMVDEANACFGGPAGRAGLHAHVIGFRRYIGDISLDIKRIVASDSEVMAWWSFTGTHDGPWLGRAPTGQRFTGTVFSFFMLRDARIARYRVWLHADFDIPVTFDSSAPVG